MNRLFYNIFHIMEYIKSMLQVTTYKSKLHCNKLKKIFKKKYDGNRQSNNI